MFTRLHHKFLLLKNDQGFLLAAYAFLRDILFLFLVMLGALLTAESVLPGFVTHRYNLAKPIAITALLVLAIFGLARHIRIPDSPESAAKVRWIGALLALWVAAITVNSLLAFPWWAILVILILTALLFITITKVIRQ